MKTKIGYTISFICLLAGILSGCVSRNISDLENQISDIMARQGGYIEPLPEVDPYDAYTYQSGNLEKRSPFKLFYVSDISGTSGKDGLDVSLTEEMEREINNRNREELEQFELDSLRMVGVMDNKASNWGVVLAPDGIVHRVRVGNYMGTNIGKIMNISEARIELREIIQDSNGRWEERKAALALIEE